MGFTDGGMGFTEVWMDGRARRGEFTTLHGSVFEASDAVFRWTSLKLMSKPTFFFVSLR